MANSTKSPSGNKPAKPHADFPLFPHATGRWAKKVLGKIHYFGPWDKPGDALNNWLFQKDDLLAGRKPRLREEDGVTVRFISNKFMNAKHNAFKLGEISSLLFKKYSDTCKRMVSYLGANRMVSDLRPDDFGTFRNTLSEKWASPVTLGTEIQRVRTIFKFAYDNELIEAPVRFGSLFKKPGRATLRVHRSKQPRKFLSADEIKAILGQADTHMKAITLLGINCGWGNQDIAGLRMGHVDLKAGTALYPRSKTGVDRRVVLWPETVKAITDSLARRPKHKLETDADLVFITRFGNPWRVSQTTVVDTSINWKNTDSVGLEFKKLLKEVGVQRKGVNFYALRHTFKTVAEGSGDIPAVNRIMGHEDSGDIGTAYREWAADSREDERLKRVTDCVWKWLYQDQTKATS